MNVYEKFGEEMYQSHLAYELESIKMRGYGMSINELVLKALVFALVQDAN